MLIWLLLLSAILRLINLGQSLWLDEAIEVLAVKINSYSQLITQYSLGDFHPPLYHLILKFWTSIFGISEISARSLSVFFGVGTVGMVYLIGKRLGGKTLGILAALFLAFAPLHIYYSGEARMYAAAAFFVSLSAYFFLRLFEKVDFFNWFGFFFATILFLYTDYLPWLMIIPFNVYVFYQWKHLKSKFLISWLAGWLVSLLFLLPWFPFLAKQLQQGTMLTQTVPIWEEVVGGFSFKALPLTAAKFIFGRISFYNKFFYNLIFLSAALFFTTLILKSLFRMTREKVFVLLWLILPVTLGWIISFFIPVYSYFRFLFVLPVLYILLACGILTFKKAKVRIVLAGIVILIGFASQIIFWTNPRFHREDWRTAVSYIENRSKNQSAAAVFVNLAQTAPYQYYAKSSPFYSPSGWQDKNLQTIWLSRYVQPIFDPQDNLRKEIEDQGFVKIEEKDFNGVVFWHYQKIYANLY
ncbi:hypothetical protein A2Z23_01675 [Candidatus Curtissbacteria bacterium RBG_16_39_7]|uniref:Glycosyltransferase RgtA/B/C/D-like domain-containing protein n=1 Tax=Candidatus Curtissbacteria bacterium RBG_16_39_7 TaxID=1797707 RepID=A0A1F5G513_9BACT|nr:MAG: hypothetical protein A2Z23_01675 [Candidatus Curtissbacteria bacterium RBG_16_39_7]